MQTMTLKVAAHSQVGKVAGAIAHNIREARQVELVAMGAEAVNQSVKSIILAEAMLIEKDEKIRISVLLERIKLFPTENGGENRDAIRFTIDDYKIDEVETDEDERK